MHGSQPVFLVGATQPGIPNLFSVKFQYKNVFNSICSPSVANAARTAHTRPAKFSFFLQLQCCEVKLPHLSQTKFCPAKWRGCPFSALLTILFPGNIDSGVGMRGLHDWCIGGISRSAQCLQR